MELLPTCLLEEYIPSVNLQLLSMCSWHWRLREFTDQDHLINQLVYSEDLRLIKMCKEEWTDYTLGIVGVRGRMDIMLHIDYKYKPWPWGVDNRSRIYRPILRSAMSYDNVDLFNWLVNTVKCEITAVMINDACYQQSTDILTELLKMWGLNNDWLRNAINWGYTDMVKWMVDNGYTCEVKVTDNILNNMPMLLYLSQNNMINNIYDNVKTVEQLLALLSCSMPFHVHNNIIVNDQHYNVIDWNNPNHVKYMESYIFHVFVSPSSSWNITLQLKAFLSTEVKLNTSLSDDRYQQYMDIYRNTKSYTIQRYIVDK